MDNGGLYFMGIKQMDFVEQYSIDTGLSLVNGQNKHYKRLMIK